MPRPYRQADSTERAELDILKDINQTIAKNLQRNNALAADRKQRVQDMMRRGWSMYAIGKETGVTPNTVKRITESGEKNEH
jgi:DNA-binding NarL/FixJ family response regulator